VAEVVVLLKVWLIVEPLDALAPVTPAGEDTVQEKVVPATGLVNVIFGPVPEQMVFGLGAAVTVGLGLTVAITVIGVPTQLLGAGPVGVMV
jgi:hypothetical protein